MDNNKINNIYLDACATTPVLEEVNTEINLLNAKYWGNPSSNHFHGIKSAEILEASRFNIAKKLHAKFNEVIFTSGATESVHLAIKGISESLSPGRIVISNVEHPAVLYAANSLLKRGWIIEYWPVDERGNIKIELIDKMLSKPTKLVSIIWGQNEIGTIQPIKEISDQCKSRNIIFHTDATQILPHSLINFSELNVDMLTASAHKFQGPKGIGILLVKEQIFELIQAITKGGNQEFSKRSGTEPVPLIGGMSKAFDFIPNNLKSINDITSFKNSKILNLTSNLLQMLKVIPGVIITGNEFNINRLPNHISLLISDKHGVPVNSRLLIRMLSKRGISVSSGSACSSSIQHDNITLKNMGFEDIWLQSSIRISLGNWLENDEIEYVANIFSDVIESINKNIH
tara:strand:- start:19875 stop:21077 length:1203 start_codon:yes stop_codon:yes gene_type:complete